MLARQGRLADAEQRFLRALCVDPNHIETLRNLALALSQQAKHREALGVCKKLVALKPDMAAYWHDLGRVHRRIKEFEASVAALRQAVELQPDLADAHHDLGLSQNDQGNLSEAETAYRRALELKPNFVEALNNLGVLLEGLGQAKPAIELLQRAVELKQAPDLLNNLGVAYAAARQFPDAIRCYQSALKLDSNYAAALNNLGNAQRSIGDVDESIISLRQALRIRPDYAEAYNNLAIALVQSGRHHEAMRYYEQAIHFRPDYAEAHMNRSLDRLALGEFEAGWIEYEWRWRGKQLRPRFADRLRWDGTSPAGKRILIHYEQGLGDTIQFIRYAQVLKKLGAAVFAEVQRPLVRLLEQFAAIDRLIPTGEALPEFDVHAPLLSLPGLLRTSLATIPADVPYLEPRKELVERWRRELARFEGTKIGIAWQGNPEYRGDRHRSIPLSQFAPLARVPGVTLINLQQGHGTEQLETIADRFKVVSFDDVDTDSGPFMDTAALMKSLDLVVTSDTALPHLAGAIGVPVWLALPMASDWRWMHGREDSPWYPTMRLFRQQERDNWEEVFERIARALPLRLANQEIESKMPGPEDVQAAEAKWREAVDSIALNRLDAAERLLLDALRFDPSSAKAHHDLGVVRGKQKRPEQAVACFRRRALSSPRIWQARGAIWDLLC